MVMLLHFWNIVYSKTGLPGIFERIFNTLVFGISDLGKIGVVLFFAVSGFVVPYSLLKNNSQGLKKFIISRVCRLYPLYWATIIIAVVFFDYKTDTFQLAANFTMFQKFIGVEDIVGVFWTLQIELIFYILCMVLFFYGVLDKDKTLFRSMYFFLALSFLTALARYITNKKLPVAVPLSLSIMFFGYAWRKYLLNEGNIKLSKMLAYLAVFIAVLLPITLLAYNRNYGFDEVWHRYFIIYAAALLIFVLLTKVFIIKNSVSSYLGKISYSTYLLHLVIGRPFLEYMVQFNFVNQYVMLLIAMFVVFAVSSVSYYLIEKPFIQLSRRLNDA